MFGVIEGRAIPTKKQLPVFVFLRRDGRPEDLRASGVHEHVASDPSPSIWSMAATAPRGTQPWNSDLASELGPPVVPFYCFFVGWEGSPTKTARKKGTLILSSLQEDLRMLHAFPVYQKRISNAVGPSGPIWVVDLAEAASPVGIFLIRSYGCGSKLNRRGNPQVLVHVSTYQGNPFWVPVC